MNDLKSKSWFWLVIMLILNGCYKNPHIHKIEVYKSTEDASFLYRQFYKNGNVKTEYVHINGVLIDTVYDYYSNGNIKGKTSFEDGKLNGYQRYYFQNGKTKSIRLFKQDTMVLVGYKEFDSLGKEIKSFANENDNEKFIEYTEVGNLYKECEIKKDRIDGTCFTYNENNEVDSKVCYTRGKLDTTKCQPFYQRDRIGPTEYYKGKVKKKEAIIYNIYRKHLRIGRFEGEIDLLYRVNTEGEIVDIIHTSETINNPKFVNDVIRYISILEFDPYPLQKDQLISHKLTFNLYIGL